MALFFYLDIRTELPFIYFLTFITGLNTGNNRSQIFLWME